MQAGQMVKEGTLEPIQERFQIYARAYLGRTTSRIGAREWTWWTN